MRQEEPGVGGPIGSLDWRKILPFEAAAASDRLGWGGLEAARCRAEPAFERDVPALTHHRLVLVTRPPEDLELRYEGVKRHRPTPAGTITLVPAGTPVWAHSSGPLDGLDLPHLRAAMGAVDAELTAGGAGGRLAAESLANILAVHLIRHVLSPRSPARGRDGTLPRAKLRAVVEYVEEHLDTSPSLEQLAAVAGLSPYYFARQFKRATGLPPHQYVVARRVERAKQLLRTGSDFSLAEVAAHAGFSDQSQFSYHFKRVLGVTPGQFRMSARNA